MAMCIFYSLLASVQPFQGRSNCLIFYSFSVCVLKIDVSVHRDDVKAKERGKMKTFLFLPVFFTVLSYASITLPPDRTLS